MIEPWSSHWRSVRREGSTAFALERYPNEGNRLGPPGPFA
jgi:hypothetical protein